MTTTTEAGTEAVQSRTSVTIVVGDDATIGVDHFTNHPAIGCYQVELNGSMVYLTEDSARALVRRLARAIAAARGESA